MSILTVASGTSAQQALIPKPNFAQFAGGSVTLNGKILGQALDAGSVLKLKKQDWGVAITFRKSTETTPKSSYTIDIQPQRVTVTYTDSDGAYYAAQTLRQLLEEGQKLPLGNLKDAPRFSWRGLHLDVSRHFFSVDFIKRQLDWMAALKMNIFHWHLTDDGGWRMEVKKYPKLTEIGAWRVDKGDWNQGTLQFIEPGMKEKPYGGFYTQAQIRDVVKYAAARHITVVPEIELPGHELAATVAYPQLSCDGLEPAKAPGQNSSNVFCAGKEETFAFLNEVLDETCELFPSPWIHIGGDEVWKGFWKQCPKCQARMKAEGLKNEEELQSYFIKRIEQHLLKRGRRMIGWDEILEGGLAPNATVMSWRGVDGGIAAAKAGHDVVMSPTTYCYFDYPYTSIPTDLVYSYDPIPQELTQAEAAHVLGVQGNVWTEWIPTESKAEIMTFPRALAMAEIGWSDATKKDAADFQSRLARYIPWMEARGIDFKLPTPPVESPLVFIGDNETAQVNLPRMENLVCRYTLDGSAPKASSPIAQAPVAIQGPGLIRMAYFDGRGRKGDESSVRVIRQLAGSAYQTGNGTIGCQVFNFTGSALKGFTIPSGNVETAHGIDLTGMEEVAKYGLRFTGLICIPQDGEYTLSLTSDDGSLLKLSDVIVIDNDGPHSPQTKTAKIKLRKGNFPLTVEMFQAGGAAALKVEISGPGIPKQLLSGDWIRQAP